MPLDDVHTPVPWNVLTGRSIDVLACPPGDPEGVLVAQDCHTEADARLIAAAPDLLDALQKLLSVFVECVQPTCPFSEAAQAEHAARKAIAKATKE